MTDLKACPFCGGDDVDGSFGLGQRSDGSDYIVSGCNECGACGPDEETEEEAIKAWNTRQDTRKAQDND